MQIEDLIKALTGIANVYGQHLTDELLDVWCKVLSGLREEEISIALARYVSDPKNLFFPRPAQILGLARPIPDPEGEACLIVEKIMALLGPCGADDFGVARAQERLCEIGRAYIQTLGGWSKFSQSMQQTDIEDLPIVKSQARKAILGLMDRKSNNIPLIDARSIGTTTLKNLGVEIKSLS